MYLHSRLQAFLTAIQKETENKPKESSEVSFP